MLSREEFLKPRPLAFEEVDVPELGDDAKVLVWTLNGQQKDELDSCRFTHRQQARKKKVPLNWSAITAAHCVRDAEGNRVFSDDDIEALGKQPCPALDRIYEVASRLNRERVIDAEALAKN